MKAKTARSRVPIEPDWASSNGRIKLYRGDCVSVLDHLSLRGIDAIVTDPPYGEEHGAARAESPAQAAALVTAALCKIRLPPNGLACLFWTMRNLDLMLDAVREAELTYRRTLTMYIPRGSARPFRGWLPRVQPIVIAQRHSPRRSSALHTNVAAYLERALDHSGLSRCDLARAVGCDPRLVQKWLEPDDPGWCVPTRRYYPQLKKVLGLDDSFDELLDREPASGRPTRDYDYQHDCYVVEPQRSRTQHHPAEKPLPVVEHVVHSASDRGVIDPFMGSGTTAIACMRQGRRFIGIERDRTAFRRAVRRIEHE